MKHGVAKAHAQPMASTDHFAITSDAALQGREADAPERHALLRETVASLMKDSGGAGRVRALRGRPPGFDRLLWKRMAELGWLGICIPEEFGGLDLGLRDLGIVAHELGKWVAPEPLTAAVALATGTIWRGDNAALKAELLPRAMSGELCMSLAWQESVGDLDFSTPRLTRANRSGEGITIEGSKTFVQGGTDGFIVSAAGDDGLGIYWIPASARGLSATPVVLADGSIATHLALSGVRITSRSVVASGALAHAALAAAIDDALVLAGAELLGVMEAVLQQTLEYLRTRVQFGRPIGEFQALQHRAVDLLLAKELASCALTDALDTFEFERDPQRRTEAAMRVKFRASRSAIAIARAAVHLHGAMGFTDECDAGLYLKRAIVLNAWLGNDDSQLQRLSGHAGWLARAWH